MRISGYLLPLVTGCFGLGCALEGPVDPPNLDGLLAVYDMPTGRLDEELANDVFTSARPSLESLATLAGLQFIADSIHSIGDGLDEEGFDGGLVADVDGRVEVHIICPGEGTDGAPDPARDGALFLHVPVGDAALGPVAFGHAEACRFAHPFRVSKFRHRRSASRVGMIDGPLAVHFGKPLRLGDASKLTPLVELQGELRIEGLGSIDGTDFRLASERRIETRFELDDGGEIIIFRERDTLGMRARRGTWVCTHDGSPRCLEDDG